MTWDYRVTDVLRVVDGDTLDLRLDLGFYLSTSGRFRLIGVDTPERGQPGWADATEYVRRWCDDARDNGQTLRVQTFKADGFGRWLADLYVLDGCCDRRSLGTELLRAGLAVVWRGRTT